MRKLPADALIAPPLNAIGSKRSPRAADPLASPRGTDGKFIRSGPTNLGELLELVEFNIAWFVLGTHVSAPYP